MTTEQIVWAIVIAVAVLVLIGLIVAAMRKKKTGERASRAEELRKTADVEAAGLPDARARAEQQEREAEHARLEAERVEQRAAEAKAEVAQQQAAQEDRIREADRLDPNVNHKAKDYSPNVSTPAGPATAPTDTTGSGTATSSSPETHTDTGAHTDTTTDVDGTTGPDHSGGTHRS